MQNLTITGKLIANAESKSTATGQQLIEFTVSVTTEFKKDASGYYPTQLYKCTLWGRIGEYKLPMLNKGVQVLVIGEPKYRIYNDSIYIDVRASEVEVLDKVEKKEVTNTATTFDPSTLPNVDDVEIDMPF